MKHLSKRVGAKNLAITCCINFGCSSSKDLTHSDLQQQTANIYNLLPRTNLEESRRVLDLKSA